MIAFVANLTLAVLMANLLADQSLASITVFMVIAFFITWPFRNSFGPSDYHGKVQRVAGLIGFFLYDLVVSSFKVAYDVITPPLLSRPRFLVVPLDAKTDAEIMLTANLISLTPGISAWTSRRTNRTYWSIRCLPGNPTTKPGRI